MYDTIILGAGMSGLAAGCRLAYYDKKVCILERHSMIGGLNSFYRQNGRILDVGLHAVTNFRPSNDRRGPLGRLMRQLRLKWEDLALVPQLGSRIAFPDVSLRFSNDFSLFESEVEKHFPGQGDGLRTLVSKLVDYNDMGAFPAEISARQVVAECVTDPRLVEMIFCPLMYYGSARPKDMDFNQFSIMFRSIFLEGFARPRDGVRALLKTLADKFRKSGGELRLNAGVREMLVDGQGTCCGVRLEDGTELRAKNVLSSIGSRETLKLCENLGGTREELENAPAGEMAFVETISVLNRNPADFECGDTIVFFNDSESFDYQTPPKFCGLHSGVICSPNNFAYDEPLSEGMVRITALANFERWNALDPEEYAQEKQAWYSRITENAVEFVPDFRPYVVDSDMFTPKTVVRFTGHENGAIYGSPRKNYAGSTSLRNLYVCGTDQGMVGIIGSIISGITIANRYLLTLPTRNEI